MDEIIDPVKYPSLPSNYVTIVHLRERWLKEKERKQQEKENQENEEKKQCPVPQNHQYRVANGYTPVGKNLHKRENHSAKGWCEVGLIAQEPKLKEVKITARAIEGENKKKEGYFGEREPRVERDESRDKAKVSIIDVVEEEMMSVVSVENGGRESSKGKCKEVEEMATVCMVEVVGRNNVDREIAAQKCGVGFMGKKHSWRKMGDGVGEVSEKGDSVEQSGQERNGEKEKVSVDVKERTTEKVKVSGAFCAYGDKEVEEVATVCAVKVVEDVVEENRVGREITGQKCRVGFRGKKYSWRKIGDGVGEVSNKANSGEQSGQECNAEKEKVSIDVKERTNEKMKVSGAFVAYGDEEVEEVATVCKVEVVEENKVDREISGQKCTVGCRGKKYSWRKISDRVGEVSDKANSAEQSGQERNAEKEKVSIDVKERTNKKVRVRGGFCAYGDKEVEEVATDCKLDVVEENKVEREIPGKKCRVGFTRKKNSWKRIGDGVEQVSDRADKADSVEISGQEDNAEKEEVSVDVKERNNEKVTVSGAFHAYSDKEVEEVATVEENKVDMVIMGQKHRVGFRGMKHSWRKVGDRVGEVSDKANSTEQSGQERNAEKESVSVDVKERTNKKVTVSGEFHTYIDEEVKEVATVEENKVDMVITGQKHRVGLRGMKHCWRKVGDRVGEVSDKANRTEQSGQERNAEKENVSVDVKERTNEKVTVSGAFHAYSDKEVEEVATVEENKVGREITGQKSRVGFRGKKHSWRKVGDRVGEVSSEANSEEQSGQERNAEKEKLSIDLKERTNEKVRVSGAFRASSDQSKDVLIDSEAGLEMMIEGDLGDLSLTDRKYGHGRLSVRVYGDRWRHGSSRRYEPRRILKQRDDSFAWIKKG